MSTNQRFLSASGQIDNAMERLKSYQARLVQLATSQNDSLPVVAEQTTTIEACALTMLQAAEDLLAVTRGFKKAWILGQVHQEVAELSDDELEERRRKADALVAQLQSCHGEVLNYTEKIN